MIGKPTQAAQPERKPPPTPPKGGETSLQVFCRNYLRKESKSLSSYVRIGTPPLYFPSVSDHWFGGLGGAFCGFFVPLGTPCNLLAVNVCALCA